MMLTEKISHLMAINLWTLFDEVLKENEDKICNLNREQMYEEGVMNVKTGQQEHYSPATIAAKKKAPFNKTEFITLKWMGNFYKTLKLVIFKDTFVISSDSLIWANYLETQTRFEKALGMTEKSKSELRELVRDTMIKKLRNAL